jgi:hypothetical protein
VRFTAVTYSGLTGWQICDAAVCDGKIELKIGFHPTPLIAQKVERSFSHQNFGDL